jgi:hypothetical protein
MLFSADLDHLENQAVDVTDNETVIAPSQTGAAPRENDAEPR